MHFLETGNAKMSMRYNCCEHLSNFILALTSTNNTKLNYSCVRQNVITDYLGSQKKSVLSPSALHTSHSLKEGWQNIRVLSRRPIRKQERASMRCWKSSHSSSPLMDPAFSARKSCSSVRGCKDARATFSSGNTRSNAEADGNFMLHCSR